MTLLNRLWRRRPRDETISEAVRQLQALMNVRPLLGPAPLAFGGWSVDPAFAEELALTTIQRRPTLVLECGSGSTTVVAAACLALLGEGKIISLEHELRFKLQTEAALTLRGLQDFAEVIHAPLRPFTLGDQEYSWYEREEIGSIAGQADVLIVDGPPGSTGHLARYPALPVLRPLLAPDCVILMDDGRRSAETAIANQWAQDFNLSARYLDYGKGAWIFRMEGPK